MMEECISKFLLERNAIYICEAQMHVLKILHFAIVSRLQADPLKEHIPNHQCLVAAQDMLEF